jgi:uncharacterized surface anchored protein
MKRLILIALALALALGIAWAPAVAAVELPVPVTITKTIPAGGPVETFTFELWRDLNNNGVIDAGDTLSGTVNITGTGTGVIYSPVAGVSIIHEVLIPGSAYQQLPDMIVQVGCEVEITIENEAQVQEVGQIVILKKDGAGNALAGATFEISPNPITGLLPALTIVDEGLNDEAIGIPGVLSVSECMVCVVCNVTETVPPPGYTAAPPQTAHVTAAGETVELTFVDTLEKGELIIRKMDVAGNALVGATFVITPDPKTGTGSLTVVDNGLNDEDPAGGILKVTGCIIGTVCTVEETVAPAGYVPAPPQTVTISATVTLTFVNEKEERGQLKIKKVDKCGSLLGGAQFLIEPNPKTGTGSLTVVDNGLNDEDPVAGRLLVTNCIKGITYTVTETVPPPGYVPGPPQTVTVACEMTLKFVNQKEERGQLKIKKVDKCGRLLGGAQFLIEPNPKTGTGSLTLVDNGLNDEDPTAGILLVTNCIKGITYTVTETVAPPGYVPGPAQTVTVACEMTLKFVNYPENQCGSGWWGGWSPWSWGWGSGWGGCSGWSGGWGSCWSWGSCSGRGWSSGWGWR